ncbi:hypothetical protein TrRE_jg2518, partial [Triparma retinervis]
MGLHLSVRLSVLFVYLSLVLCQEVAKKAAPPVFFLQDSTDGQCLSGSTFTRCSIDTLWFVSGSPGSYRIHKRTRDEGDREQ